MQVNDDAKRSSNSSGECRVTVLLPVYVGDDPRHFEESLASIYSQDVEVHEVLIVVDGPVKSEVDSLLTLVEAEHPNTVVFRIEENGGLAQALKAGVEQAKGDLIARMDADDVAEPGRIRLQMNYFAAHPSCALLGGQIREFTSGPQDGKYVRRVPLDAVDIRRFARKRNPFNHVTVVFNKAAVVSVGNYEEWSSFEDYQLWAKLIQAGYEVANLPDILVNVRTESMHSRRGGAAYVKNEAKFRKEMVRLGMNSRTEAAVVGVLAQGIRRLPPSLRRLVYNHLLRSN